MASREEVHAHRCLEEALPARRLGPGRHRVAGAAVQLQRDPRGQHKAGLGRGAEAPFCASIHAKVGPQQRHHVLGELRRPRHRWRRECVARQLLVRHEDLAHRRGVKGRRLATSHVEGERHWRPSLRKPPGKLHAEASAHGEADEHELRSAEVRQNGLGERLEKPLVVRITRWHQLIRAGPTPRKLHCDNLNRCILLLGPGREDGRGATCKRQAIGTDRWFLAALISETQQEMRRRCGNWHCTNARARVGVGCRRRIFGDVYINGPVRVHPERGWVERV
mmetsp:Transcript_61581/g.174905  ORF Transcript_61581/g.174905 Transcript_61581/m.174905 type:complete len:279 (+) Transcript_61581:1274-2110(+)